MPQHEPAHQVTALLHAWSNGDERALDQLTPLVYAELQKIARKYMAQERRNHTLQPTALINETYVRLVDLRQPAWHDRTHLFALAGASDAPDPGNPLPPRVIRNHTDSYQVSPQIPHRRV